jgi:phage gp36-like protein
MAYTTVDRVKNRLGNIIHLADLDDVIEENIENADGLIDSFLSTRYVVPISGTVPAMIRMISEHLAAYFTAIDYIPVDSIHQTLEALTQRYDQAMGLLDRVAKGKMPVPGIATHPDKARLTYTSTDENTPRFFDIDDETEWGFSEDNLDEIKDERRSNKVRIPDEHA